MHIFHIVVDKYPPVDLVVEAGVVPRLLQLLSRNDLPNLQLEAAWAITNVACAEVRHVRLLINNGTFQGAYFWIPVRENLKAHIILFLETMYFQAVIL